MCHSVFFIPQFLFLRERPLISQNHGVEQGGIILPQNPVIHAGDGSAHPKGDSCKRQSSPFHTDERIRKKLTGYPFGLVIDLAVELARICRLGQSGQLPLTDNPVPRLQLTHSFFQVKNAAGSPHILCIVLAFRRCGTSGSVPYIFRGGTILPLVRPPGTSRDILYIFQSDIVLSFFVHL